MTVEGYSLLVGILSPLFLLRRTLSPSERGWVRGAAGLWLVGVGFATAAVLVNRDNLRLVTVLLGDRAWIAWAALAAFFAAGGCLLAGDQERRKEKERRDERVRDGLPLPADGETPEAETRRLLAEVERLKSRDDTDHSPTGTA